MSDQNQSFEQVIVRLESIVLELERSELSLEQAIAAYKEGVSLAEIGHGKLRDAERIIEEVAGRRTRPVDVERILVSSGEP
jgi:exodeoxyribonuclease VII small subunit